MDLIILVDKTVKLLESNPKNPVLGSHKVETPKFGNCFSSPITRELRLIWQYDEDEQMEIIDLHPFR